MTVLRAVVALVLVVFTVRRYVFALASCLPVRPSVPSRSRSVCVMLCAHDEEQALPRTLAALGRMDYPRRLLHFVLVNDGSNDQTLELMRRWRADSGGVVLLELPERVGKAAALQEALAAAPQSELIVVFDADAAPAPDCVAALVGAFDDPAVGIVSGYPEPENASASLIARYAALERWVYQLVIQAGRDRLGANPPANGPVFAFRRSALDDVGGFPVGRIAEDIELSLAATRRGWRTRWIGSAVAREDVVSTFASFWNQRQRWSRGMYASVRNAGRVEDWLIVAGYTDRLALLAAIALLWMGSLSPWWLAAYGSAPLVSALIALPRAKAKGKLAFLVAAPVLFWCDVAVTVASVWGQLRGKPVLWNPRPRRLEPGGRGAAKEFRGGGQPSGPQKR